MKMINILLPEYYYLKNIVDFKKQNLPEKLNLKI